MGKRFEIFKAPAEEEGEEKKRQLRILRIVNSHIVEAEIPKVSQTLHVELHKEHRMDTSGETERYEEAREDVCMSFGVPDDEAHRYLAPEREGKQRAFRAFVIFIDRKKTNPESGLHEAFYGEGRTAHHELLKNVFDNMSEYGIEDATLDAYIQETDKSSSDFTLADLPNDPNAEHSPRWLFFKGFLLADEDEIAHLPEGERNALNEFLATRSAEKEHLADEEGEVPTDTLRWFLTGSNVPSSPSNA
ncbi:MAG: hypothetical protein V1885_02660 [Candidatus Brennerbacteria bacterium]